MPKEPPPAVIRLGIGISTPWRVRLSMAFGFGNKAESKYLFLPTVTPGKSTENSELSFKLGAYKTGVSISPETASLANPNDFVNIQQHIANGDELAEAVWTTNAAENSRTAQLIDAELSQVSTGMPNTYPSVYLVTGTFSSGIGRRANCVP